MGVAGRDDNEEVVTEEVDGEQAEVEGSEQESGTEGEGGIEVEGEATEEVVQIGDEAPPPPEESSERDSKVFSELRTRYRELDRENKELKAKLGGNASEAPKLPERPKLADFDYDEEKHQEAMDGWYAKKREVEAHEAAQEARAKQAKEDAQKVHEAYAASKKALTFKDVQEAEDEVLATLSDVQQALILEGAKNSGLLVYALGKNQSKLRELASITNPVKLAFALGELEGTIKVTKRASTSKAAPETTVRGNTSASTSTATLDRLRAEADKTGDRSKVVAFLKQQKQAGK